jgi:hypothetical protein
MNTTVQDFLTEIKIFLSFWQDILWQAVWSPDQINKIVQNRWKWNLIMQ